MIWRLLAASLLFLGSIVGGVAAQMLLLRVDTPASAQGGELSAGDIVIRTSGQCGTGFVEVTSLNGRVPLGTLAANADQGGTGGSDTITPTGTNSSGAVSAHSGTAVADHASHTHTYTEVVNHTHLVEGFPTATGGSTGFTRDTSMSGTPVNTNQATANPTGGVATGTTNGPSATLTHSVTQPSNHTFTQPTFTGDQFDNRSAFQRVIFCEKQ